MVSMMAINSVYHLIDGVLDEGLPYIAKYVEGNLKHSIVITDHDGHIHYPLEVSNSSEVDDVFVSIPALIAGRDYFYQRGNGYLYYRVRYNGSSAYIIAQGIPVEQISQALSVLSQTRLAVKCYFAKLRKESEHFERELAEYLFNNSNASIRDIARLSENRLEMDRSYFVTLVESEEESADINMQLVRSYLYECLKKDKFEAIPLTWSNTLAMVIPVCSNRDSFDEPLSWPAMIRYKAVLEKKFSLSLAQGGGRVYPLDELRKSFYEARIALTLPRLLNEHHYVQKFSDLGIYYPIFCQSPQDIKSFCWGMLGRVIEYDEKTDGELMPTLRKLLDSNVNMKSTADSLFIHVNTLYYRVNKIEELLGINFSSMDSRVNLFIAIKVWDTLKANGFVD
jgi:sugar diacid utilization regulator